MKNRDCCGRCAFFRNDPSYLEAVFGGLNIMSSAWASVTSEDGLCSRHDRYGSASGGCADFTPVGERDLAPATSSSAP